MPTLPATLVALRTERFNVQLREREPPLRRSFSQAAISATLAYASKDGKTGRELSELSGETQRVVPGRVFDTSVVMTGVGVAWSLSQSFILLSCRREAPHEIAMSEST